MKGTGAGWDSWFYRIFLIGGILAVLGGVVYAIVTQPANSQMPLYIGVGGMAVFMVLLIGYWVVQIVFLGYGSMKPPDLSETQDVSDITVIYNWDTLFTAMVTEGGNLELINEAARKGNSSLIIWFLWTAVIALCPIAMMVLLAFDLINWSILRYAIMFYIGIVIFMSFLTFFLGRRSTEAGQAVIFQPLGLKLSETPNVDLAESGTRVRGRSVVSGQRFGREVEIILQMGYITTKVLYPSKKFEIKSKDGHLTIESGAPQAVYDALQGLRKAQRWENLEVTGDQDGIVGTRNSRRQSNFWLYDLWLIERIISEMERDKA